MTDNNHFMSSVADLMSGLMVIFMFIAIAYMYEIKDEMNGVIYITEGYQDTEHSLYQELYKELKNDLEMREKVEKIQVFLESLKVSQVDEKSLLKIMKTQELVKEIYSDAS